MNRNIVRDIKWRDAANAAITGLLASETNTEFIHGRDGRSRVQEIAFQAADIADAMDEEVYRRNNPPILEKDNPLGKHFD